MNVTTLARFLFGQQQAIHAVAGSRHAVWLGALFVLSAGFAREYDGEDLWHEPWHLLIPFAASLATSFLLYALLRFVNRLDEEHECPFFRGYRTFLALYWMTAPLAWLYAIPVERLNSAGDATRINLYLLGLVALWRVVLMTRIVSVMFQGRFRAALFPVMLFADSVAIVLLILTPMPVISIMGGIRLTESEVLIQSVTLRLLILGFLSWPVWVIGTLISRSGPARWKPDFDQKLSNPVGVSAWLLAAAALLIWIPILPGPQREQQLRREVENDLCGGRIREALDTMSRYEQSDFPPHWDPPPRIGYGESTPRLFDVFERAHSSELKPWVREIFEQKLIQISGRRGVSQHVWRHKDADERERFLSVLEKLPKDSPALEEHREIVQLMVKEGGYGWTRQQIERIRKLYEFNADEDGRGTLR